MVELLEFLKASAKLYFGFENRIEGFEFINMHVLWLQPFFMLLFLSLWHFIISTKSITIFSIIGSALTVSLASFIAIYLINFSMVLLGGTGKFIDMYKFGLSIWIFPTIINIFIFMITLFAQNNFITAFFGIFLSLVGIYTIIVSILIYGKIHNLSTEYSFLGILLPFIFSTIIIILFRLTM